jgi:hypothetical protein
MGLPYSMDSSESELNGLYSTQWSGAKRNKTDRELMTLRFLSVQLFAAIAIALASGFLPPGTPFANEMEATRPLV